MKQNILFFLVVSSTFLTHASSKLDNPPKTYFTAEQVALHTKNAQDYAQLCAQTLTCQELQLLANVMYYSCAFAIIDHQVRAYTAHILMDTHHMNQEIHRYASDTETQEKLIVALTTLKKAVALQQEFYVRWKHCIEYSEQQKNDAFIGALETWQTAVQGCVATHAQENDLALIAAVKEQLPTLSPLIGSLNDLHDSYENLIDKQIPVATRSQFIVVTKSQLSSQLSMRGQSICGDIVKTLTPLTLGHNELQKIAADSMTLYYQALYEHIGILAPKYTSHMFSSNGIIPEELRAEKLPALIQ